ncbi:MAG: OsmC family protein [Polyangiaceae bacterium]|nr:OsmC family protein [Polyangiaceae bacterium]MCB9606045.1 OsmC family protein [Polyangiaceae bacterium]
MVDINIDYEGELHCQATHGPSGAIFHTDAPKDNHGKGESFSPTDLVATGLGTCMITVMGIQARSRGYDLQGALIHVKKHMTASAPRRIARLDVSLVIPKEVAEGLDDEQRKHLEHTAHTCPVRLSLLPAIDVPVSFSWG